ncbi:Virion structural protein [Paramixta manurensis]|uniref:Virion structural protein n=1 Tax=Paramixta manurensis TaxID=2740817 RepID=A0A6M8UKL6_9GAMM|nr:Virion structural protein [Erwiniaceae bacterium PD-1]
MTTITKAQANKLLQVALFTAANRNRSFVNILTEQDAAPKQVTPDKKGPKQTSFMAPVVRVTDLTKTKGDSVDMQIIHKLSKRPTMGDKKLAGRGENLNFSDFDLGINQGRHLVDAGGKMSQQRYKHDLRAAGRTLLGTYFNDLQDQSATFHLAGARGDFIADDTIVPLASHHEFNEIMVNDVLPPTYDRHFYAGDATRFQDIDAADLFSLSTVDNMSLYLDEMAHPLQPVRLSKDELKNEDPYYALFVTPRQWNDWYTSTSGKDWQAMLSRAIQRSKGFAHPLFQGECAMWRNILVRKYSGTPVRFFTGSQVSVSNNDNAATTSIIEAPTNIDRAMLLGGQALASAWGIGDQGGFFGYHEEKVDHDNGTEISISWINGLKKIRFQQKNGRVQDHGVMVVDSAISGDRLAAR